MNLEFKKQQLKVKELLRFNKYKFINNDEQHFIILSEENKKLKKLKPKLTDVEKQKVIQKLLSTEEGRQSLARSFAQPIRTGLNYSSFSRAFSIEPLSIETRAPSIIGPTYV